MLLQKEETQQTFLNLVRYSITTQVPCLRFSQTQIHAVAVFAFFFESLRVKSSRDSRGKYLRMLYPMILRARGSYCRIFARRDYTRTSTTRTPESNLSRKCSCSLDSTAPSSPFRSFFSHRFRFPFLSVNLFRSSSCSAVDIPRRSYIRKVIREHLPDHISNKIPYILNIAGEAAGDVPR